MQNQTKLVSLCKTFDDMNMFTSRSEKHFKPLCYGMYCQ